MKRIIPEKLDGELICALQPFIRYIRAQEAAARYMKELPNWQECKHFPFEECASKLRLAGFADEALELIGYVAHDPIDAINWVLQTQRTAAQRIVQLSVSPSQIEPVSSQLKEGALRRCIQAREDGQELTPSEVNKQFGRALSKLKGDARALKDADLTARVLAMLNSISK